MTDTKFLEDQQILSGDFSGQSLEGDTYIKCQFKNCNFSDTLLRGAKFISCTFNSCNFSLAKMEGCRFQDATFIDSKVVGGAFFKCERILFSVNFRGSTLLYCNFSELNLKGVHFKRCTLKECHFSNTQLSGASFEETDLSGTLFHNSDLSNANFVSATHYNIDPRTNKIKHAKFSLLEAVGLLQAFEITIVDL